MLKVNKAAPTLIKKALTRIVEEAGTAEKYKIRVLKGLTRPLLLIVFIVNLFRFSKGMRSHLLSIICMHGECFTAVVCECVLLA